MSPSHFWGTIGQQKYRHPGAIVYEYTSIRAQDILHRGAFAWPLLWTFLVGHRHFIRHPVGFPTLFRQICKDGWYKCSLSDLCSSYSSTTSMGFSKWARTVTGFNWLFYMYGSTRYSRCLAGNSQVMSISASNGKCLWLARVQELCFCFFF